MNAADVDDTLFVPEMGFGELESAWFDRLARKLPEQYRIIPVPARGLLLDNGGIHCAVASGRDAGGL